MMWRGDQLEGGSGETVGVGIHDQLGDLLDQAGGTGPKQFRDGGGGGGTRNHHCR